MIRSLLKSLVKLLPKRSREYIHDRIAASRNKKLVDKWKAEGAQPPPPHPVKQLAINEYKKKYAIRILVETGTYLGDMVEAQRKNFDTVFSIELSPELWRKAVERFDGYPSVKILQGDSGVVLHNIMPGMDKPALFWLDGHFSAGVTAKGDKDCPIFEELDAIFAYSQQPHVLLIDDARLFIGQGDYPTVESLTQYIRRKNPKYTIQVKDDIIRATVS
jgi:hypothetical protein